MIKVLSNGEAFGNDMEPISEEVLLYEVFPNNNNNNKTPYMKL